MSEGRPARREMLLPYAVCVAAVLMILAPAFRPGVVIAYDMPWSPDPRWTPFTWGIGTPAPRAVPSDAVAVLIGTVVGSGVAQLIILGGILIALGAGAVALLREVLPRASGFATVAAGLAALWNPYVGERLVVGQWTVLLGAALVPWIVRAGLRERTDGSLLTMPALVGLAGVGGANSLILVGIPAVVVLLGRPPRWMSLLRLSMAALGVAAVWALPSVLNAVRSTISGAMSFAASADSPVGVVGSLLAGGGNWNAASHLASRSVLIIGVLSAAFALVCGTYGLATMPRARGPLATLGLVGLAIPLASVYASESWSWVTVHLPGGGLLRDSQKFVVWWLLVVALGAGLLADRLAFTPRLGGAPIAVLVAALPVALLPTLAWGVGGRVTAVEVPDGYRRVAAAMSDRDPGLVGLLPWNQYRRYEWNGSRVSLTLGPRMVDQDVLFDDSLPLVDGRVPGEDPRAAAVSRAIDAGAQPVEALRSAGVRYIMFERGAGFPDGDLAAAGPVVIQTPEVEVREMTAAPAGTLTLTGSAVWGWAITTSTWLALACLAAWRVLAKLPIGLLRSRA